MNDALTDRPSDRPTDPPDPAVTAILERAGRLTAEEARRLDAALRHGPDLEPLARQVLSDHQGYLNHWAMFDHWSHPWDEMVEARHRVGTALGTAAPDRSPRAFEPDDGSVGWGAATAAAYAVLACGRACQDPRFLAAWVAVLGK
jgi:hypothetical protein